MFGSISACLVKINQMWRFKTMASHLHAAGVGVWIWQRSLSPLQPLTAYVHFLEHVASSEVRLEGVRDGAHLCCGSSGHGTCSRHSYL